METKGNITASSLKIKTAGTLTVLAPSSFTSWALTLPIAPAATNGFVLAGNTDGTTSWVSTGISDGDKGDITVSSSGSVWTIDNDVVTYAKMQNVVNNNVFLGRISGANGDVEELTGTQATSLLNLFSSTLKGLVPLSGGGSVNYLRADGTWAAPAGSGTVTTISFTDGNGFDGTITSATTTPVISMAIQSALNGALLYSNAGALTAVTIGSGLSFLTGTLSSTEHGTVTSINLTQPSAGITVSGGPITSSGSITLALADDLLALESLGTTGIPARTAANTWSLRAMTGTVNQIVITDGNGVLGNPTFALPQDIHTAATPQFAGLGIGTAALSAYGVIISTTTPTAAALGIISTISPAANNNGSVLNLGSTIVEAGSGTHALLACINIASTVVTAGAAAVTNTAQIYAANAMSASVTGKNYVIWMDNGENRFDGPFNSNGITLLPNQIWAANTGGTAMEGKTITQGSGITVTQAAGTVTIASTFNPTVQSLTDGATITWNVANGGNAQVTIGATGRTLSITNPIAGHTYTIEITQGTGGSKTITTWPTGTTWVSGTPPTLSTAAGSVDLVVFYYNGSSYRAVFNGPFA